MPGPKALFPEEWERIEGKGSKNRRTEMPEDGRGYTEFSIGDIVELDGGGEYLRVIGVVNDAQDLFVVDDRWKINKGI